MRRIQPQASTSGLLKRGSKGAVSEMSQSMMDLSVHKTDTNDFAVPRFKVSLSVYLSYFTVCVFMKRRGDGEEILTKKTVNRFQRF